MTSEFDQKACEKSLQDLASPSKSDISNMDHCLVSICSTRYQTL